VKKFNFPLGRVMDFRRAQARIEEVKLEGLHAELRALDTREAALNAQQAQSEKALKAATSVTGFDLELFDSYREATKEELRRLAKAKVDCSKRVEAQLQVLITKRRDVRLLEKLKEQRLGKWEKEMFKEIDSQAEEAYLAKWKAQ
jgi:flagellar export protein FliJ